MVNAHPPFISITRLFPDMPAQMVLCKVFSHVKSYSKFIFCVWLRLLADHLLFCVLVMVISNCTSKRQPIVGIYTSQLLIDFFIYVSKNKHYDESKLPLVVLSMIIIFSKQLTMKCFYLTYIINHLFMVLYLYIISHKALNKLNYICFDFCKLKYKYIYLRFLHSSLSLCVCVP